MFDVFNPSKLPIILKNVPKYSAGISHVATRFGFVATVITWDSEMKKLIRIVLALPIGSADVERGFSIKNHFKTNWRSKMTTSHIEDIMRIRIKGPEIQDFDPVIYTLHWLNTNHLESDESKEPRQSVKKEHRRSTLF